MMKEQWSCQTVSLHDITQPVKYQDVVLKYRRSRDEQRGERRDVQCDGHQ